MLSMKKVYTKSILLMGVLFLCNLHAMEHPDQEKIASKVVLHKHVLFNPLLRFVRSSESQAREIIQEPYDSEEKRLSFIILVEYDKEDCIEPLWGKCENSFLCKKKRENAYIYSLAISSKSS